MNDPNANKKIVSQELDDRIIEVQDDGSVKVTEIVRTIYTQDYRDFLSDIRNMQKFREQVEDTLKPDFVEKQQERIDRVSKDIESLQPFVNDAESKWLKYQDEQRVKGIADKLKEELAKPSGEVNVNYVAAVWDNIKKNEAEVMDLLSDEEKEKFSKFKLKAMKKAKR